MHLSGKTGRGVIAGAALLLGASALLADSYVASNWKHAWGENVGWSNWADANGRTQGVEVYQNGAVQYLKGWVWFENIGWANVGNGAAPYLNTTGLNFGVNINPITGVLTGYAWSENAGWINFGPFPAGTIATPAQWDHTNFRSRGWAWAENAGWINLDDAIRYVCAIPGDFDSTGNVNVFDFAIFVSNFGTFGNPAFTNGDCDGDGDVDVFDFGIFAPNFGASC